MKNESKPLATGGRPAATPIAPQAQGESPADSPQWERRRIMSKIHQEREKQMNKESASNR